MDQIEKSFKISCKEQFSVTRQVFIKSTRGRLFYSFFVGMPVLFGLMLHFAGYGLDYKLTLGLPFSWLCILMLAYVVIVQPYSQYLEVKRTYNNNPAAQEEQHVTLSAEGFKNSGTGFDLEAGWEKILKLDQSSGFLLFFISKNSAYFIPLKLLSSDEIAQIHAWYAKAH